MLRERRQQAILEELERAGSVSVAALSRGLGVINFFGFGLAVARDVDDGAAVTAPQQVLADRHEVGLHPAPRRRVRSELEDFHRRVKAMSDE